MTAKLICPQCGAAVALDDAASAAVIRECFDLLARFGYAAPLVREYVGLFRLPARGLPWDRVARLLSEMAILWETGKYTWDGCTWQAEKSVVADAIRDVIGSKTLTPPLKDHNYLKAILHKASKKYDSARERETEAKRRSGRRDEAPHPDPLPEGEGEKTVGAPLAAPEPAMPDHIKQMILDGKMVDGLAALNKWKREKDQPEKTEGPAAFPQCDGFRKIGG